MMSTAFLKALRKAFPQAQIDAIVKEGFEKIPLPEVRRVIPFNKKEISAGAFGKRLRNQGYDAFFILPPSFSAAWMAFSSRIPHRIGYHHGMRGLLLNPAVSYKHKPRSQHLIQEYLDLLNLSYDKCEFYPQVNVNEDWIDENIPGPLREGEVNWLALAPGSTYGSSKAWPVEYYRDLTRRFHKCGLRVIVLGSKEEEELGRIIADQESGALNLCGKTSITALIATLTRVRLLIANDSGLSNVMAALQKPQLTLFGSSSPVWSGPHNPHAKVLYKGLACSPCFEKECPLKHQNCLKTMEPQEVFEAALRMLQKN